jgi:hypothetical protein
VPALPVDVPESGWAAVVSAVSPNRDEDNLVFLSHLPRERIGTPCNHGLVDAIIGAVPTPDWWIVNRCIGTACRRKRAEIASSMAL